MSIDSTFLASSYLQNKLSDLSNIEAIFFVNPTFQVFSFEVDFLVRGGNLNKCLSIRLF